MPSLVRRASLAARRNPITWKYGFNLGPTLAYARAAARPSGEAEKVVTELNRDGIAVSSVQTLLAGSGLFAQLDAEVARLEQQEAEQIRLARECANDASSLGTKTFLYEFFGKRPRLDPESVFVRFALQPQILQVVNAYFGMYTRFRECNVWRTFRTAAPARESMLWHRDREDLQILKVFVYLNDVDEGAGPFVYARGTHCKGNRRSEPEFFRENGVQRSGDQQMAAVVPPEHWTRATGVKGTVIFADTHGYHKGVHALTGERLLYHCMFTSPASESPELMTWSSEVPRAHDPAVAVATLASRRGPWLTIRS